MEPLLLLSKKLRDVQKSLDTDFDLHKGKGNRDGLIQQIITYVRDGRTITRKQWVRSEFADHAKKNEEEKKDTLLKQEEREENKRKKARNDANAKIKNEDKRTSKKVKNREDEMEGHHSRPHKVSDKQLEEYKKRLDKQRKKEQEERKKQAEKDKKDSKDKKKPHDRYGQSDQTKADNKAEERMIQS